MRVRLRSGATSPLGGPNARPPARLVGCVAEVDLVAAEHVRELPARAPVMGANAPARARPHTSAFEHSRRMRTRGAVMGCVCGFPKVPWARAGAPARAARSAWTPHPQPLASSNGWEMVRADVVEFGSTASSRAQGLRGYRRSAYNPLRRHRARRGEGCDGARGRHHPPAVKVLVRGFRRGARRAVRASMAARKRATMPPGALLGRGPFGPAGRCARSWATARARPSSDRAPVEAPP